MPQKKLARQVREYLVAEIEAKVQQVETNRKRLSENQEERSLQIKKLHMKEEKRAGLEGENDAECQLTDGHKNKSGIAKSYSGDIIGI